MITGLGDRLNEEVMSRLNQSEPLSFMDAKVIPSSIHIESGYNKQRKTAVWIGASMMASFDAYKSLCVTKEEYDEGGEQSLFKACF
jgi:actin-related protein